MPRNFPVPVYTTLGAAAGALGAQFKALSTASPGTADATATATAYALAARAGYWIPEGTFSENNAAAFPPVVGGTYDRGWVLAQSPTLVPAASDGASISAGTWTIPLHYSRSGGLTDANVATVTLRAAICAATIVSATSVRVDSVLGFGSVAGLTGTTTEQIANVTFAGSAYALSGGASAGTVDVVSLVDSSGNGRTLTKVGTVSPVASPWGGFGGAAQLTGVVNNRLEVPAAQSAIFTPEDSAPRTWEFKYRPVAADFAGSACPLSNWQDQLSLANAAMEFRYATNGAMQLFYVPGSGTSASIASSLPDTAGELYDYAFSYDGTALRLLRNGFVVASVVTNMATAPNTATFKIGQSLVNRPAGGVVEEVRISDIARYTGDYDPADSPYGDDDNTMALWHLDTAEESSGATSAQVLLLMPFCEFPLQVSLTGTFRLHTNSTTASRITVAPTYTSNMVRSLNDSAPAGDSLGRAVALSRLLNDSANLNDVLTRRVDRYRSLSDAATVADSLTRRVAAFRALSDSAPAADTLSRSVALSRALSDSATINDTLIRRVGYTRNLQELLSSGGGSVTKVYRPIILAE
ncbi:MAG: LamG-like jellyroll fold domain-containing protein [Pseudomonadota bacterium]